MNPLAWIAKLFAGPLISALSDAYKARLAADNDESRLVAETSIKDIERQIADREAAKEIRLATATFWEMRLVTALVAGCFALHLFLVTLDTCFALGWRVAAFPKPFDEWQGTILLSFFGVQAVGKGINAIASAIRGR
jgi:hypothetical protein